MLNSDPGLDSGPKISEFKNFKLRFGFYVHAVQILARSGFTAYQCPLRQRLISSVTVIAINIHQKMSIAAQTQAATSSICQQPPHVEEYRITNQLPSHWRANPVNHTHLIFTFKHSNFNNLPFVFIQFMACAIPFMT